MIGPTDRRLRRAIGAALLLAVMVVAPVTAAETTRDTYREAVEPICKKDTEANERIFAGVRKEVQRGEYKAASRRFTRAAAALQNAMNQIRRVPQPLADQERLAKWLQEVKKEIVLFNKVASLLKQGKSRLALHTVVKLTTTANRANAAVIPFEFKYCRLEPSRFT